MKRTDFLERLREDPVRYAEFLDGVREQQFAAEIGRVIRELREGRGWSLAQLGNAVGMGPEEISQIEAGTSVTTVSVPTVMKLAQALGRDVKLVLSKR